MNTAKETRKQGDKERNLLLLVSLFPCLLVCFCLGCQNCDHVEAELRSREAELSRVREQLHHTAAANAALQQQLQTLQHCQSAKVSPGSTAPAPFSIISSIVLARQTGGYDADHIAGDEAMQVVLEPRTPDGQTIRAAGSVHLQVLEVGKDNKMTLLSSWDVSPEELNHAWRPGLWSNGYFLVLPWKTWPATNKLHLLVRFTDAAGHTFPAEKTFTIRPTAPAHRKTAPPAEPETPLPAPRPVTANYLPGSSPVPKPPPTSPALPPLYQAIELLHPEPLDNPMLEPQPKRW